jgi:hypothetical protein
MQALPFIASGLKAKSQLDQGKDAKRSAFMSAAAASAQGYADEAMQRRSARQLMGEQAAAMAQAGGGAGGTNAGVIEQSAINAEMDALNIRYGAATRAFNLREEGRAAKRQGKAAAVSTIFQAAAKAYGQSGQGS